MPKGRFEGAHKVPILKIPSLIFRYPESNMGSRDLQKGQSLRHCADSTDATPDGFAELKIGI
jgi:hypothetical protein